MALETFPYDAAEFLTEPQDVFFFLEAELEMEEPAYWPGAIAIVARARGGFQILAKESSIPVEQLTAAADESTPSDRDLMLKLMESYRPAGSDISPVTQATHAH